MTLVCDDCGSYDLRIEHQSYDDESAYEAYECQSCGAEGPLSHDSTGTTLRGSVTRDWA